MPALLPSEASTESQMHRENRVMSGAGTSYFYGTNIKKSAVVCVSCVRCVTQELLSRQVITELHRYTSCGELPGKPPQPTAARPADLSQMSDLRNCYTATLTQIPATSDVRCSRLSGGGLHGARARFTGRWRNDAFCLCAAAAQNSPWHRRKAYHAPLTAQAAP